MIVSWNWLTDYVDLPMSLDELTERLTLTGLNLEGIEQVGDDTAIDLEVTSNRPDCLGHVGVAREISVLWDQSLKKPDPQPAGSGTPVAEQTSVEVTCPELCPRYTARVIKGVKIGPSPDWLADRLRSLGIAVINNVVDISNYVMMECGQPLHAFDFGKLSGGKIIVRESQPGEKFTAINHQEYELQAGTCVIADGEKAVALAGVMGGADSEVSDTTVDLLIEAADFAPLSVRNTARRHNLHSPSSYRFERGVDPAGIDWASRRCCELILELAGGELCEGVIDVDNQTSTCEEIKLRFTEVPRILGIDIPAEKVGNILTELGCEETHTCDHCIKVIPPTWRADLTREIDLIEEVARIHGYDQIPEDAGVKMVASTRSREDRVLEKVRDVMVATGFNEAMTISAVEPDQVEKFQPWTTAESLSVSTPVLRRADQLRQTLVPSLLTSRRTNEKLSNTVIELFEIANVYLPQSGSLPDQRRMLTITSGGSFAELKGVLQLLVDTIAPGSRIESTSNDAKLFAANHGSELKLGDRVLGYLGTVSDWGLQQFELRGSTTVAEIDLGVLVDAAVPIRRVEKLSPYPPVGRDLNLVVEESVVWSSIEKIVLTESGDLLEHITFQDTYRDADKLGAGKKSLLFSIQLRSPEGTLTNQQADGVRESIVAAVAKQLGGELRA
ncbi:MAG: phenylalanine--tRNA ligase subunit beta [Planctomycetota bacterium]